MSIEDDARAVIIDLLRGKQREHGVFSFSVSPYSEIVRHHYWLARLLDDGCMLVPSSYVTPRDAVTSTFYDVLFHMCGIERDTELPMHTPYQYQLLGPLGLAALRASLTTTTVGDYTP